MLGKLFKKPTVSQSTLSTIEEPTQNDTNEVVIENQNDALSEVVPGFLFPSVDEIAQKASNNLKTPSNEEILEEINKNAGRGMKYAAFFESTISDTTLKLLKKQGYNVKVSTYLNAPCFTIYW